MKKLNNTNKTMQKWERFLLMPYGWWWCGPSPSQLISQRSQTRRCHNTTKWKIRIRNYVNSFLFFFFASAEWIEKNCLTRIFIFNLIYYYYMVGLLYSCCWSVDGRKTKWRDNNEKIRKRNYFFLCFLVEKVLVIFTFFVHANKKKMRYSWTRLARWKLFVWKIFLFISLDLKNYSVDFKMIHLSRVYVYHSRATHTKSHSKDATFFFTRFSRPKTNKIAENFYNNLCNHIVSSLRYPPLQFVCLVWTQKTRIKNRSWLHREFPWLNCLSFFFLNHRQKKRSNRDDDERHVWLWLTLDYIHRDESLSF